MGMAATAENRQAKRGAALLLCMVFTGAALGTMLVLSVRIVGHVRHAEHYAHAAIALAAAEAAVHGAVEELNAGGSGRINAPTALQWSPGGLPVLPTPVAAGNAVQAYSEHWYAIAARREGWPPGIQVAYGVARAGAVERRIEQTLRRNASGVWERITWREMKPGDWEEP